VRTVELEDELKSVKREMAQLRASEAKAKNDARSRERALKQEVDGLKQNINDLVEEVRIRFPRSYSSLSALRRGYLSVS
jgi:predicted  nucleic acid-binding Zn-ribbon protein